MSSIQRYDGSLMIEVSGAYSTLNVEVASPPEPQASIFLIHDLAGTGKDFESLAPHLARLGYRVIMPDLPGRGKSARLPADGYTLAMYLGAFIALANAHGQKRNLILGQGWGAMMAMLFESAIDVPLDGVLLVDLPESWSYATDEKAQVWGKIALIEAETAESFMEAAAQQLPDDLDDQPMFLNLVANRLTYQDDRFRIAVDPNIFTNLQTTATKTYDIRKGLPTLRAPGWIFSSASEKFGSLGNKPEALLGHVKLSNSSNATWHDPALLLPVLGALQLLEFQRGLETKSFGAFW